MPWKLDSDRPIFLQIIERIQMDIIAGYYQPGDKLPSVRELAQEASVNPNTMQKALSELERTGLVYAQRTSGRFITEDINMIEQLKSQLAKEIVTQFLENMYQLGFQKDEILELLSKTIEVKGENDDTIGM
ncbi:MAG: GntR family transcriptional regulator [Lachnospiraceae bacterium]|nr:GntR family transcriptional regulator [Lachnospiraceae bacterium]